ncbi:MAG TPA: hypothetical protein VKT75_08675 [Acidobacteriaceae bacterium]|nr:hypothetical protein [Acidobacteriaceae bacterium]
MPLAQKHELVSDSQPAQRRGNAKAVWTLLLLAPFVAEVLSGATRLSFIFVFIPEVMVWGTGALLAREIVRRWRAGWPSLLMLGLALSVWEEFLCQQTSLAPLPWAGASVTYARLWGVNWLYFLFMLAYESIWVVMVPVQLTELFFPARRELPWLRTRGIVIASGVFAWGSFMAWFAWVQRARPKLLHVPAYNPPAITLLVGVLAIAVLIVEAWLIGRREIRVQTRSAPSPLAVGIIALLFGLPWYGIMALVFSPGPHPPFWIPMIAGVLWAGFAYAVFRRFTSWSGWTDAHRCAACFAATIVCMAGGFLGSGSWLRIDLIGKCVFNAIAVLGFALLMRSIRARERSAS